MLNLTDKEIENLDYYQSMNAEIRDVIERCEANIRMLRTSNSGISIDFVVNDLSRSISKLNDVYNSVKYRLVDFAHLYNE